MIKIFRGAGVVTPSKPPPPMNNFCLYPPPVLKMFLERSLNDPHPHHPTSSIFHCYPHPIHHPFPPLKISIIHIAVSEADLLSVYTAREAERLQHCINTAHTFMGLSLSDCGEEI